MIRQFELVEMVRAYNPGVDEAFLNRAYVFGVRAHGEQVRASGEPYFNHPVEVAAILTELKLDDATIVTALLHDTLEDTHVTFDDLTASFGREVAQLVDGVTKLSKLTLVSKERAQAENLRKLFMAMARDPRVLLVKLADRLHNMRTIGHLKPESRQRIARETLEIFAPLAGRMGMQWMKEELEDLSFAALAPEARLSVMRRFVHLKQTTGDGLAPEIVTAIKDSLSRHGVEAEVKGREKRPYAIWMKMQTKEVSFEQLSDIIGFRIIVDTDEDCYRALGVVHRAFRAVPGRFKDYISGPKANGYRSLHTTVVGPNGARVEMQIRTHEMHEVAESGLAAHWSYKAGVRNENRFAVDPSGWLKDLVARGDAAADAAEDFLEDAKLEMSFDQVFCFTPRGDVIGLPLGATALDFAYAVHTGVGHTAVGAKINGKRAPLWTPLRNGQTVEILQSAGQKPAPVWRDMVKTGRARAAIRRTIRDQERRTAAELGEKIVRRVFERVEANYTTKAMEMAAQHLGLGDAETLLAEIGAARLAAVDALRAVYPELAPPAGEEAKGPAGASDPNRPQVVARRDDSPHSEETETGALAIPAAPCCLPLPGERVVALREPQIGYRLHTIDCPTLERYEGAMERWSDVVWSSTASERAEHLSAIDLTLANEPGALGQMCSLIGGSGANIHNLAVVERKPDFFRLEVMLEVRDLRHLTNILRSLSAQPIIADAARRRPLSEAESEARARPTAPAVETGEWSDTQEWRESDPAAAISQPDGRKSVH